jgi:hypothetical protein
MKNRAREPLGDILEEASADSTYRMGAASIC